MKGHLFIAPGDITQLGAHTIAYSASNALGRDGNLYSAFAAHVPGFAQWYDQLRRQQELPREVGEAFWMPLNTEYMPFGVVTVVSTGQRGAGEDKAALAVRSALTVALRELRAARGAEHLLIALPAFRLGKDGDRRQRLRSARAQIDAARQFLAENNGVDVAFIPYTTPLYHIYLEARRAAGETSADGLQPNAQLEQALLARECVVFVGAGLSSGAGLPGWDALIQRLGDDLGVGQPERHNYLDLAQWYRERFGRDRLADVLRRTYATKAHPTLGHYLLMALPVRHVITTNYDDLLERALTALKRHPLKVIHQQDVARTGQDELFVVKLHGDLAHADEITLTRDDYEEFFDRRPAMALLLEGLLLNQTFLFVGYGLRDPNFRQIHGRIVRMLREAQRPAFATTFEASSDNAPYLIEQWKNKQLRLLPIRGADRAEQGRAFLRFLDELAARVSLRMPQLFLAPEVDVAAALAPLRRRMSEEVGAEMEAFAGRDLSGPTVAQDVRYLAEVLEFLATHGWRPHKGVDLCRLWEHLSAQAPGPDEKRRLLIAALGAAEAFIDVERIRGKLGELEQSS